MEIRMFEIWVTLAGEAPEIAFHWRGSAAAGIAEARREAAKRGLEVINIDVVPVHVIYKDEDVHYDREQQMRDDYESMVTPNPYGESPPGNPWG